MVQDNRFKIYRATNRTKGEIYIGISRDLYTRLNQHAKNFSGGAKRIKHWNWSRDDIKIYTYPDRFNSKRQASLYAHDIERECRVPEGYEVHLTSGT